MRCLWLLVFLAGCGGRHADPVAPGKRIAANLPEGPPLVTPGERMSYVLKLGGMSLATYDLGVGEVADLDGKQAIIVQGHAKSSGFAAIVKNVDDTYTSWIDAQTGRSLRWLVDEQTSDGANRERTDAQLGKRDGNTVPVEVAVDGKQNSEPQTVSMKDVWDYNAFLIVLRSWEAPRGSSVEADVFRSRYMWHTKVTVVGKETLATELGDFPTLRIDGESYRINRNGSKDTSIEPREFTLWISDDASRVPLQTTAHTDYGEVTLSIVEYQPGTGSPLRTE
ncbi:MAG TPA: DUF3108 domain-containing protein [Kofleriaceae bacterium]|jgi:hypothetical protein|nr:DUF3108 domain-containing protein [Kofleriaceae bacterium]